MFYARVGKLPSTLPASALNWLKKEAVPPGATVDFDREERLFEDFESFLFLWNAEDGEMGRLAAAERNGPQGGKLVDLAFTSRWQIFENVRRDRGEWMTM
jgi:hypothetical protein